MHPWISPTEDAILQSIPGICVGLIWGLRISKTNMLPKRRVENDLSNSSDQQSILFPGPMDHNLSGTSKIC